MVIEEEKDIVVGQIEKFIGNEPVFYLKFVKEEKFAHDLMQGKLYAHSPEYFRKLEINSGNHGQGDKAELINVIECTDMKFINKVTGNCDFILPEVNLEIQFKSDNNLPIVSFVGLTINDLILESYDRSHATFLFPFTENEFNDMSNKFGPYCVLINGIQFRNSIKKYACDNNLNYIFDKVQYCIQNTIQRMRAFENASIERFLYKNEDFEYQREYRLAIDMQIPHDNFIRIDSCEKFAKSLKSNELKNMYLSIGYELEVKDI